MFPAAAPPPLPAPALSLRTSLMSWEEFAFLSGPTKTFACARVFSTPRLCSVRFPPRVDIIPSSYLAFRLFFCQTRSFFLAEERHDIFEAKATLVAGVSGEEWAAVTAVQESHCEVSALSDTSLLCAATFVPQQLLRFVCAWSFGIFDIFRIFPLPLCWFRASRVRRGAPVLSVRYSCAVFCSDFSGVPRT